MADFSIDQSLGYLVAKTNLLMKSYFSRAIKQKSLDITPEQWAVLYAVVKNPGISQTEIARISMKDKANATHIIDALEKKGYIKRIIDHEDRRVKVITPTSAGEEVLKRLIAIAKTMNAEFMQDLTATERQSLIESLRKISSTLENILADLPG
ncbi:Transcriptional regulator SlyA [uncultured archaeon]|nr:Transcriptional regulator SlyA [uncultured archaeon]